MNQSEAINELAGALAKAQAKLQPALKAKNNPFFSSKYADLAAVWDAARDVLTENGISVVQAVDVLPGEKPMTVLRTILLHTSGQWMGSNYPLAPVKPDPQAFGSAVTYARRYALSAMIGLVSEEDDDGNQASLGGGKLGSVAAKGGPAKAPSNIPTGPLVISHISTVGSPYRVTFSDGREASFFDDPLLVKCANFQAEETAVVPTITPVNKGGKTYFNLTSIVAAQ